MCRSRAARVLCTVSHTYSVSSGVQCWFLLRLTFWGVVVPQEGHAQVGKTVPEVASTGEAETRISACSCADLTLCCRRDRRGFCEECLRLKDYEIYGFAVLAADRAGCGFADALVGCTGGVLVPPFSAYPQR